MAPLRLAILETGEPTPDTAQRLGSYTGVFTDLFTRALQSEDPPQPLTSALHITAHDVVLVNQARPTPEQLKEAYPLPEEVDAVLLTGSKYDAFADDAWILTLVDFVKTLLEEGRVKVVGVCFGHQIVARALGGKVVRNGKGWEVAVTECELTARGREVFSGQKINVHQMHRDIVAPELPPELELLAKNDVCTVQAFLLPGRAIAVQGHPEFTEPITREILELRHHVGVHSAEVYKSGMAHVADEHDGVKIGRVFLRFMRGDVGGKSVRG